MSLFRRIFGSSNDTSKSEKEKEEKSPYTPEVKLPIDEMFTFNFKKNGGKFIYCENLEEVSENFINILEENDWFEKEALCFDSRLFYLLDENKITRKDSKSPNFILASCENLIADNGSILFSSNQFRHFKPDELPKNMVIFATTSQLVASKSEGLSSINHKYTSNRPSNITTITYFQEAKEEDFLNYGRCHKNLYLLLLEDL